MSMHKSLALDTTRPYFRRENKVKFLNEVKENDPLYNPHEALQALPGKVTTNFCLIWHLSVFNKNN